MELRKRSNIHNTIIIPAYNEEQGISAVLEKIFDIVDTKYEVIVVDDCSTDKTADIVKQYPCKLIRNKINLGKGLSLRTAMRCAQGENIIWIDGDDTYPVKLIPEISENLQKHDMVVCSRMWGRNNIPFINRIGSLVFRFLIKRIHKFQAFDPFSGLCGVKKRHLDMMQLSAKRFAIEPEICIKGSRMKLKILDVPITYHVRTGNSKLNWICVGFEDLWMIFKLVTWRPKKERNG